MKGERGVRVVCPVCLISLPLWVVGGHVFSEHGGGPTWVCGVCGLATPDASEIAAHALALRHDVRRIRQADSAPDRFLSALASLQHSLTLRPKPLPAPEPIRAIAYEPTSPVPLNYYQSPQPPSSPAPNYTYQPEREWNPEPPEESEEELQYKVDSDTPVSSQEFTKEVYSSPEPQALPTAYSDPEPSVTFVGDKSYVEDKEAPASVECGRCGRSVSGGKMMAMTLFTHVMTRVHGKYPQGMYQCSVCHKRLNDRKTMKMHIKASHEEGRLEFVGDLEDVRREVESSFSDVSAQFPQLFSQPMRYLKSISCTQ